MGIVEAFPSSEYVTLFTFYFPESGEVSADPKPLKKGVGFRYVSASEDITVEGSLHTAEPSLEYSHDNPMTGSIEQTEFSITCTKSLEALERLSRPYPVGRVTVEIREYVPGHPETIRTLLFGIVGSAASKRTFRDTVIKCKCIGTKKFIKDASEMSALSTCTWKFGAEPCGYDLAANTVDVVSIAILPAPQANRVEAQLDTSPSLAPERWKRGYLFNTDTGTKVMVRELVSADLGGPFPLLTLDLSKIIDPVWASDTLVLVPGCDKQVATCRVHLREEAFAAFGIGMPGYNPSFFSS